jgi:hypothetical protein
VTNLDPVLNVGTQRQICDMSSNGESPFAATEEEQEMPESSHWYVSYTVTSHDGSRRNARRTKTFDTEERAKLFAKQIAPDNPRLTAGTINPHSPKIIVSPTKIMAWLDAPTLPARSCRVSGQATPERRSP